jgi:hypothetical protein
MNKTYNFGVELLDFGTLLIRATVMKVSHRQGNAQLGAIQTVVSLGLCQSLHRSDY